MYLLTQTSRYGDAWSVILCKDLHKKKKISVFKMHQTFFDGRKSIHAGNGAEDLINPRKTSEQVERDYREGHQHYVRTHNAYFVGKFTDVFVG